VASYTSGRSSNEAAICCSCCFAGLGQQPGRLLRPLPCPLHRGWGEVFPPRHFDGGLGEPQHPELRVLVGSNGRPTTPRLNE